MDKKGSEWKVKSEWVIIIMITIFIFLIMWIGGWECKNNNDCEENEICTYEHECYKPENLQTAITKTDYSSAAFILGVFLIIAVIIYKSDLNIIKKIKEIFKK